VAHLKEVFEVSQRRACAVLGVDRTMVRYVSRRADDAKARERIRELASQRRRFCYRRLHWLLCREGWAMNHKKFRRLYREERLQVRRRGGRKRALGTRAPMTVPQGPNQRWGLELGAARPSPLPSESVSDAFASGRRFRIFAVVDGYSRECARLIADMSIPGARVGRKLDAAVFERMARPHTIVSDNGTELTSMTILRSSKKRNVEWHYIAPGKPYQNGFIERLAFGQLRFQCAPAGRVFERDDLHQPCSCPRGVGSPAARLQPIPAVSSLGDRTPAKIGTG